MRKAFPIFALAFLAVVTGRGVESFSLLTYNVHGFGVEDWSTNSPQVQAIGREVRYLQPDILTCQEVPYTNTWQLANWVVAYLPGYFLATNSCTDGAIRSVILSRYPIARSQSWLCHASLADFGYSGVFTRDLFEAEITVPGYGKPVHVFTTHLKAGQDTADSARRAAEASAISNFLVTVFLPAKGDRAYLLTGDLNEDIARPPSSNPQSLQRLTSAPTGLRLTTPTNPVTRSELTWSTQSGFVKRYDYILPGGLLWSNVVSSQVFRSDVLANPPPPLQAGDTTTASDHAPVVMAFRNPYNTPFRLLSIALTNQQVTLRWESAPGRQYRVEASSNLALWVSLASNVTATGANATLATNATEARKLFRVYDVP